MESELLEVVSADGTILGVEHLGRGPALVAVHGGTADRSRWAPVREALGGHYSLYLVDRRGRGASLREAEGGYTLQREVEDVQAVIDLIGGPVLYLGHSYGALIGIEVLRSDARVSKALLYEPPFDAEGLHVIPLGFIERYAALVDADARDEALDLFYREVIGMDPEPLHALPVWQARKLAAHTLVREAGVAETYVPDPAGLAGVDANTLVLTGAMSPDVFGAAARLTAEALPGSELVVAEGHAHTMIDADPAGFVALVRGFLT